MGTELSAEVVSRMHTAFERFKIDTLASNRAYLGDLAGVCEARDWSSSKKMGMFVTSLPSLGWDCLQFQSPRQCAEEFPEELLNGVWGPAASEESRKEFFNQVLNRVNDHIKKNEREDAQLVELPEEYMALLQRCDGLQSPDLRENGRGGLFGTAGLWDNNCPAIQLGMLPHSAIHLCGLTDGYGGWEFRTAFMIENNVFTQCGYAYCRRVPGFSPPPGERSIRDPTAEDDGWKWRIFYSSDRHSAVFDSLVDYLAWLGCWYDREIHGDTMTAAEQVDNPPEVQGTEDFYDTETDTWDLDACQPYNPDLY